MTTNVFGSTSGGHTTGVLPSPYLLTKSRSRWSCAGQPKIAPVPYSIRMKFATYTGSVQSGSNGWIARMPVSKPSFSCVSTISCAVPWRFASAMNSASFGFFAAAACANG